MFETTDKFNIVYSSITMICVFWVSMNVDVVNLGNHCTLVKKVTCLYEK